MQDQANRFVRIKLKQQYIDVDFNCQLAQCVRAVEETSNHLMNFSQMEQSQWEMEQKKT